MISLRNLKRVAKIAATAFGIDSEDVVFDICLMSTPPLPPVKLVSMSSPDRLDELTLRLVMTADHYAALYFEKDGPAFGEFRPDPTLAAKDAATRAGLPLPRPRGRPAAS